MVKKEKHDYSIGGEISRLSIEMIKLKADVRTLAAGEKLAEDLPAKLVKLKEVLASIKLRQKLGTFFSEDPFRIVALENEIGRVVLQMDGVL